MAVTSIWYLNRSPAFLIDYAINPEKTQESISAEVSELHTVGKVIEYAADDLKTETREFVTCIGCISVETAAREFMQTKRYWNKMTGRVCFHGYQSFRPGEVNAATAHEIGVKLATRIWGEAFQVVIATHCNTNCYHNHFVVNSVSWKDGHHYHNSPEEQRYFRDVSDWLCKKYRLSVIENPKGRRKHYSEYMAEKQGRPTYRGTIRGDIDRAIQASLTLNEFFRYMEALGYTLKLYGETGKPLTAPSIRPPAGQRFLRFDTFGDDYDLEAVKDRILQNAKRQVPLPDAEQEKLKQYRAQTQPEYRKHVTGLRGLYLRFCYELHIIRDHPASAKQLSSYMRYQLTRLDRLDDAAVLLGRHQIDTIDQLSKYRGMLMNNLQALERERSEVRNELRRLRRRGDSIGAETTSDRARKLGKQILELRKEVALCNDIANRSARTRAELEDFLDQQKYEREKEDNQWPTRTTPRNKS